MKRRMKILALAVCLLALCSFAPAEARVYYQTCVCPPNCPPPPPPPPNINGFYYSYNGPYGSFVWSDEYYVGGVLIKNRINYLDGRKRPTPPPPPKPKKGKNPPPPPPKR